MINCYADYTIYISLKKTFILFDWLTVSRLSENILILQQKKKQFYLKNSLKNFFSRGQKHPFLLSPVISWDTCIISNFF